MPNQSKLSWGAGAILIAALAIMHGVGRIAIATPHLVPIDNLPHAVGDFTYVGDVRTDPAAIENLKTARVAEKTYGLGARQFDCLLLTATDPADFHSPLICFPAQGWRLERPVPGQIDGIPVTRIAARRGLATVDLLYWYVGGNYASRQPNTLVRTIYEARRAMFQDERSLFVRLYAARGPGSKAQLEEFAGALMPYSQQLVHGNGGDNS
jgi:hypothetical protein